MNRKKEFLIKLETWIHEPDYRQSITIYTIHPKQLTYPLLIRKKRLRSSSFVSFLRLELRLYDDTI